MAGEVNGSETALISKRGRVQGNIVAPRVQLDDGALFRGSIDMNPAEPAGAKKAAPGKPAAEAPANKAPAPAAPAKSSARDDNRKEPNLTLKSG